MNSAPGELGPVLTVGQDAWQFDVLPLEGDRAPEKLEADGEALVEKAPYVAEPEDVPDKHWRGERSRRLKKRCAAAGQSRGCDPPR